MNATSGETHLASRRAFKVNAADNVATLLDDAPAGLVELVGEGAPGSTVLLREPIARGHKVALVDLTLGAAVVKFGVRIGHATQPIAQGAWVHLQNLASDLDERSGSLDLVSGAPTDTHSAYV